MMETTIVPTRPAVASQLFFSIAVFAMLFRREHQAPNDELVALDLSLKRGGKVIEVALEPGWPADRAERVTDVKAFAR